MGPFDFFMSAYNTISPSLCLQKERNKSSYMYSLNSSVLVNSSKVNVLSYICKYFVKKYLLL